MLRRLGIGLAILIAGLLSLLLIIVAAAQVGPGQRLIVRGLNAALAGTAEVEGLSGIVPFDMRIERIALVDQDKPWLTIEGLVFDWSASRLLGGVVDVTELAARRIEIAALPAGGPDEPEPENDEPFRLPELPDTVPLIQLDRLAVDQLVLAEPVIGERAVFAVRGHAWATDQGRAVEAALDVTRSDQASASVGLRATVALDPLALNLDLRANESGDLVERLAGLEESGDFELRLVGNGPLRAWRADLNAGGAGLGRASGVITLALVEQPKLGLQLELEPSAAILPDDLEQVIGETVEVALDVTQTAAQGVRLDSFRLGAGALTANASGTFAFDAQRFDAKAALDLPRLAALEPLAGMPLGGGLTVDLAAHGPFLQPEGRIGLVGRDLAVQGNDIAKLDANLELQALADLDRELAADAMLSGRLEGVEVEGVDLPARDIDLALTARRPPGAPVELDELRVSDGNAALGASGSIDPESLAGTIDLKLTVERLAELTRMAGAAIDGRLDVSGPVRVAADAARIASELQLSLDDLSGLPPDLAPLVGERVAGLVEGAFEPGKEVALDRFRLENDAIKLEGRGNLGLADQAIDGELALGVSDLAVLTSLAGSEMAGAVAASATLGGTVEQPTVDLQVGGDDLVLAGRPVDRLALDAAAEGIQPSTGQVKLEAALPRLEATFASSYRYDGARLALENASLEGTGVKLTGNAVADLASGLTTGRFQGGVEELARLDALLPVALRGRVKTDLRLERRSGRQTVAAALEANEVRGPFGLIERAALTAEVDDALAEPKVKANLRVNGFRQETNRVDRLEVTAQGGLDELVVSLSTAGEATVGFEVEAQSVLALGDATRVRIERIDGSVADQPLRLVRPATIAVEGPQITVSALELQYAGGRLSADADLGPGPVKGEVRIADLPLGNLEGLGAPPIVGRLQAGLDLSGDAGDPTATLEVRISGLRSPDPALGDVPPLDIDLTARLAERRLQANLRASGLTEAPATAEVALPLLVNLEHFAFELPQTGALGGGVDAELQLARLDDIIALDGQRLEGRLTARLDLGGTLREPAINGRIALADGIYENGTTGTVLRKVTLRADVTGERLVLRELSATDGGSGRLSGSGELQLAAERDFPLDFKLNLTSATLVRRDDARVTFGGDLEASGNLQRAKLAGQIVVERAEIGLPDPSSEPTIAVLDVEEVGEGFGNADEAAASAESNPRVVALDLVIRVPDRFFVRGRGLESEWQGRLVVQGSLDEPNLVGDLSIRRGFFDFLDRRFDLDEGSIGFTGGLPPTPDISVKAVAETDDMTAIVEAVGTPDDLTINLSSDPQMPQDEILSRLLFNRDVSSISPVEAASLAMAVNRLRGGSGGLDILGRARKALGVDTLDVGGAPGEETVRAGKYLSDDVYVEVEKGQADEDGRARVELEVLPNVSVEADVGQDQNSGVGVRWQYDF